MRKTKRYAVGAACGRNAAAEGAELGYQPLEGDWEALERMLGRRPMRSPCCTRARTSRSRRAEVRS